MSENEIWEVLLIVGILIMPYYVSHTGPSQRDRERDRIQEEIWELEKKQDATFTSYSPSRQEKIDKLTNQLKNL